jgi:predicted tellurium resistance membrane protein TerC
MAKATLEIHQSFEDADDAGGVSGSTTFAWVVVQIMILDIVFSLDSVITAVGLAEHVQVMIAAIVISVAVMLFAAKSIGDFVDDNPTIKMLALSFLVMIGMALVGEVMEFHIPKGYIYFAMAFSVVVELLNLRVRKLRNSVTRRKDTITVDVDPR